jgi:hypothetical protein
MEQIANRPAVLRQELRTPRAAAVAGIVFALLFSASMVLIRLSVPDTLTNENTGAGLETSMTEISLALILVPFSGIAFLWFLGVIRDRLGSLEDQFFSTVFFGSGLLFLAMMFAAAGIAGGVVASYAVASNSPLGSEIFSFGRAMMYTIMNIYAIRMAGVFMISLATIWTRTRVMPRWLALLTYGLALVLLISINLTLWLILVFPGWVFLISAYILTTSLRSENQQRHEVVSSTPPDIPSTPKGVR